MFGSPCIFLYQLDSKYTEYSDELVEILDVHIHHWLLMTHLTLANYLASYHHAINLYYIFLNINACNFER